MNEVAKEAGHQIPFIHKGELYSTGPTNNEEKGNSGNTRLTKRYYNPPKYLKSCQGQISYIWKSWRMLWTLWSPFLWTLRNHQRQTYFHTIREVNVFIFKKEKNSNWPIWCHYWAKCYIRLPILIELVCNILKTIECLAECNLNLSKTSQGKQA